MDFAFSPQPVAAVPLADSESWFPVHRIYCVGRNYGDHVKEMGGDPKQEPPVFFSKPSTAVVINGQPVVYPQATEDLHHEVELVIALSSGGKYISVEAALDCVYGYAVGVDLTRRDLQAQAKNAGRPWDVAKGFDQSAPISPINPVSKIGHPNSAGIRLSVNNEIRQDSNISDMIWTVTEIIAELSNYFELKAGDLIFTGTPAGVSALEPSDHVHASIEGVGSVEFDLLES